MFWAKTLEADWEIEIGADAPLIEITWPGFVNLRGVPEDANKLPEVALLPCLASVLVRLNTPGSTLFTVKCDVWAIYEIDPSEFDAESEAAAHGLACYVDLLPRNPEEWPNHEKVSAWCNRVCATLRSASLRSCRADLVLRQAVGGTMQSAIGVTAYLAACGPTEASAKAHLAAALVAFADAIVA